MRTNIVIDDQLRAEALKVSRKKGITIRKTADVIIATLSLLWITLGLSLL